MTDTGKLIQLDNIVRVIQYDEECIPTPELQVDPGPKPYCKHEHINIYKYHRKLYCKDCGATLDAFDWVVLMGEKEGMQFSNLKYLDWEIKRKKDEIAQLEKDIAKLKSQKRRV